MHEVSGDERVIRRTRQMKGGETVRELRLSIWIISFILFVHFSLVNTFLPIIYNSCLFQALDFLDFIPVLNVAI